MFAIAAQYAQESGKIHEWCKSNENHVFLSRILYTKYYAQTEPHLFMEFGDLFNKFYQFFPREVQTEKDLSIVKEFLVKYGTHFPEDGFFGGRNNLDAKMKSSYVNETTEKWCSQNFKLKFMLLTYPITLGMGIFHNKSEIHVDEEFNKNSDWEFFFQGGLLKYQTNDTLEEWRDSIDEAQVMTNGTLTLFHETFDDAQKAATLKKATEIYINNGEIKLEDFKADDQIVKGYQYLRDGFNGVDGNSLGRIFEFKNFKSPKDGKRGSVPDEVTMTMKDEIERNEISLYDDINSYANEVSKSYIDGASLIHSRDIYRFYKQKKTNKKVKSSSKKKKSNV